MSSKPADTILVADDEADIRASLKMILEYEGLRMIEAASGPEALEQIEKRDPDAVMLDIKMPKIDGLEALAEIRERRPELPVVMISGHATVATAVEATNPSTSTA